MNHILKKDIIDDQAAVSLFILQQVAPQAASPLAGYSSILSSLQRLWSFCI